MNSSTTLLLVEDNLNNLDLLKRMLERAGYTILTATNGNDALKIVNSEQVDLFLFDINLPKMSGIELLQEIRKMDLFDHVPAIAVTANSINANRARCMEAGFDYYLMKPVTRVELLDSVNRSLSQPRPQSQTNS